MDTGSPCQETDCGTYRLRSFARLDSTNTYARERLRELRDRDVIEADLQTAGHGRMRRAWISHVPGNLCLSLVLKPTVRPPSELPLVNLSQLLAVSLCHVLEHYGVEPTLKWPNDVQVGGRKIAGILAESLVAGREFLGVILGIGVNLNLDAITLSSIDQPATSLHLLLAAPVDKNRFRQALLDGFFTDYARFLESGFALIRDEYRRHSRFLGQTVEVRGLTGVVGGTAHDFNLQGELVVMDKKQRPHTVSLGELSVPSL